MVVVALPVAGVIVGDCEGETVELPMSPSSFFVCVHSLRLLLLSVKTTVVVLCRGAAEAVCVCEAVYVSDPSVAEAEEGLVAAEVELDAVRATEVFVVVHVRAAADDALCAGPPRLRVPEPCRRGRVGVKVPSGADVGERDALTLSPVTVRVATIAPSVVVGTVVAKVAVTVGSRGGRVWVAEGTARSILEGLSVSITDDGERVAVNDALLLCGVDAVGVGIEREREGLRLKVSGGKAIGVWLSDAEVEALLVVVAVLVTLSVALVRYKADFPTRNGPLKTDSRGGGEVPTKAPGLQDQPPKGPARQPATCVGADPQGP